MNHRLFAGLLALLTLAGAGALQACADLARADAAGTQTLRFERPIVLLGEVHDNAAQHALRLDAFAAMLAEGARPALLMEQFDREHQPAIDRLLAAPQRPHADALIATAGGTKSRWNWTYYRPIIELALAHSLPIVAVNVSRTDAQRVVAQGLAATGFDARVPAELEAAQAGAIERSHCGMVDAAQARRMAAAQIARDQFMAHAIEAHAARGALLLAGNGHVRSDIGVPRWLEPATRSRTLAVGLLEQGDLSHAAYDRALTTARQQRDNPCDAARRGAPHAA